jgi:hypothetical protein
VVSKTYTPALVELEPAATEPKQSVRNDFINVYEHVKTS